MIRQILKSKINNSTVVAKKLSYSGSIGIDKAILKKANISQGEKVQVLNFHNGAIFETYVIEEPSRTRKIVLYGPAARLGDPGDKLCIMAYAFVDEKELAQAAPTIITLKDDNKFS
jgi:aspartate 1-decarboxylase